MQGAYLSLGTLSHVSITVHLVRHGKVENPKAVIYGRLPGFHLSERGRKQAEAAAGRLADADIGAVWASPLERAQETAAIIAAGHDVEVTTDDRLIESGTTLEGVSRSVWSLMTSPLQWWKLRNPLRPSWGESFAEIRARMLEAVHAAIAAAAGKDAVVVSHQTPVLLARLALAGRNVPPWLAFTPCATGSVTTVVLEGDRFVSASYYAPRV
jgi:broad specificity phosphatase PhoE